MADPCQKAVDRSNQRQDCQHVRPWQVISRLFGDGVVRVKLETHKICPATINPNVAPLLNAWRAFAGLFFPSSWPRSTTTFPRVTGSSSSGSLILLIAIEAGILITDEVTRFWAGTPSWIYAVSTEPAIVENPLRNRFIIKEVIVSVSKIHVPEVIVTCNSDSVITSTYGRTRQALSPWPTHGDAAATTASAPETFIILKKSHALGAWSAALQTEAEGGRTNVWWSIA